jgi:hypothetical protein
MATPRHLYSRCFHISPFSNRRCADHRSVVLGCLAYAQSTPCCRSSPPCFVYQSCNSDYQIYGAGVSILAGNAPRPTYIFGGTIYQVADVSLRLDAQGRLMIFDKEDVLTTILIAK